VAKQRDPSWPRARARLAARLAASLVLAAALVPAGAPGAEAAADARHLEFIAHQSDVPLTLVAREFTPQVKFDPAHPADAKVRVLVDLKGVDGGGSDADRLLRGRDFFDVARYPQAAWEATEVRSLGGGRFEARGTLALKGHSAPVNLQLKVGVPGAGLLSIEGEGEISRLAFGIGEGSWSDTSTVDDKVTVKFRLRLP